MIKKQSQKKNSEFVDFVDEEREWISITPSQRILETTKLWQLYLALGGSLDPEPDPQSPFYFQKA